MGHPQSLLYAGARFQTSHRELFLPPLAFFRVREYESMLMR